MESSLTEPELVWECFNQKTEGFFVEVGANDPKAGSQTWLLESKGWRGILVEPLPPFASRLRAERPNSMVVEAACARANHPPTAQFYEAECPGHSGLRKHAIDAQEAYVASIHVRLLSLDEILAQAGNPVVDFLSIDVEGMELEVLNGFDLLRWAPALLLIEDHLFSLGAHLHIRRLGYRLVRRTGLNSWYIPYASRLRTPGLIERIKLWRKVWAGTPFRWAKHRLEERRAKPSDQ
jgi:FkbM family methyltransferase